VGPFWGACVYVRTRRRVRVLPLLCRCCSAPPTNAQRPTPNAQQPTTSNKPKPKLRVYRFIGCGYRVGFRARTRGRRGGGAGGCFSATARLGGSGRGVCVCFVFADLVISQLPAPRAARYAPSAWHGYNRGFKPKGPPPSRCSVLGGRPFSETPHHRFRSKTARSESYLDATRNPSNAAAL
jgi:hypothetical protein